MSLGMSGKTILLLCVSLLHLTIAGYVLRHRRDAFQSWSFALLGFAVALWSASLSVDPTDLDAAVLLRRLSYAAASLMLLAIVLFAASFGGDRARFRLRHLWILTGASLTFVTLSFSPWIVSSMVIRDYGVHALRGPLHHLFLLYAAVSLALASASLAATYRSAPGRTRIQLRYVFLAIALPGPVALATNLLLPVFAGTSRFGYVGPLLSLITLGLIGHAIVHHRLMDIRLVIRRGAVRGGAVAVSAAAFALVLIGANFLLPLPQPFTFREVALALALGACFTPLRLRLEHLANRYLLRPLYDFRTVIRDTSRALASTIRAADLLDHLGTAIDRTLHPEHVAIYLLETDGSDHRLAWHIGDPALPEVLSSDRPSVTLVRADRPPVFRDEIDPRSGAGVEMAALAELAALNADALVPLVEQHEVLGFVLLGPKRSGEPLFTDDVDLLTTLASHTALAVRNAQAHEEVIEVSEELQKVLSTIDSGVISVDASGRVRIFNAAAERLTGIAADTAKGGPVERLPAPLRDVLAATPSAGPRKQQREYNLTGAMGRIAPVLCSTAPLLGPGGEHLGLVAVFDDLSHLKDLERERRRTERLATVEAMASGLVHEVRNPLVALKTFAQVLPMKGQDSAFRETFARVVSREIGRVDELLERFRTLAGPPSQPMALLDIAEPLHAALELTRPRLEMRRIRLNYLALPAPPPVLGNASQLEQLFLNLLLNAIEVMEDGGELSIRVGEAAAVNGRAARVEVSDTGPGIPEELLPRIFNPFVTTKTQGTGLGLAICRSVADAHRAQLDAQNNSGRPGCTFVIEFPPAGVAETPPATVACRTAERELT
jgi:PAS domain S-box-containing protein